MDFLQLHKLCPREIMQGRVSIVYNDQTIIKHIHQTDELEILPNERTWRGATHPTSSCVFHNGLTACRFDRERPTDVPRLSP